MHTRIMGINNSIDDLKGSNVILFGAGCMGIKTLYLLKYYGVSVRACFDNDEKKQSELLWGIKVLKPHKNLCHMPDKSLIIICVANKQLVSDIKKQCIDLGYEEFGYFPENKLDEIINKLPDKEYLELIWRIQMGTYIDIDNPKSFSEKLQWLKLYDRNPQYSIMVDKFESKKYISSIIGDDHTIPTIGIWDSFEGIDFSTLPNSFVLKCTHDSGSIVIVRDKFDIDLEETGRALSKYLGHNYYYNNREWPYKNVKPRIIAEEYLTDESGTELMDYKVFNFNGEPKLIQVDINRFVNHKRNFYDTDWNYIDMELEYKSDPTITIPRPKSLRKMLELARLLSRDILFVRTDFYCVYDKVFWGEMTFYPGAGYEKFYPVAWDYKLGEWLNLPVG